MNIFCIVFVIAFSTYDVTKCQDAADEEPAPAPSIGDESIKVVSTFEVDTATQCPKDDCDPSEIKECLDMCRFKPSFIKMYWPGTDMTFDCCMTYCKKCDTLYKSTKMVGGKTIFAKLQELEEREVLDDEALDEMKVRDAIAESIFPDAKVNATLVQDLPEEVTTEETPVQETTD